MTRGLTMLSVTDAIGLMVYRDGQPGNLQTTLTFLSNDRGADVLDAIRTCEKDIRQAAPNCEIANYFGEIGDQLEAMLDANNDAIGPA